MFCESCDRYTRDHRSGYCASCRGDGRDNTKILGGAIVGGIVAGPLGIVAGGILGSLLGEKD